MLHTLNDYPKVKAQFEEWLKEEAPRFTYINEEKICFTQRGVSWMLIQPLPIEQLYLTLFAEAEGYKIREERYRNDNGSYWLWRIYDGSSAAYVLPTFPEAFAKFCQIKEQEL